MGPTQPAKGLLLQLTRLVARPGEVVVVYVPTQSDAQTVAGILASPPTVRTREWGPEFASCFRVFGSNSYYREMECNWTPMPNNHPTSKK